jgi:1,2-diacylglycerol 3-beta-galactosyltransferase
MADKEKRILILTGDAGLGHRSAAEAILKAVEAAYGDRCEVLLKNPLNHPDIPDFIRESQSDYDQVVKTIPELYHLAYDISDAALPATLMEGGFILFLFNTLRKVVLDLKPDLIITTYPIFQAPLIVACDSEGLEIPIMTVVTDLVTVHQIWFNDKVTQLTVPTESVRKLALDAGLSDSQVIITGIPVDPDISKLKNWRVNELRAALGWDLEKICLLVVGSPRVFDLMGILHGLDQTDFNIQFALVAGGNDDLFEKFEATDWHHPVKIYNFVDFLPKLMRAADMILCKAGGLITTESLASGLPIMVVNFLPGQEEGNVAYIIEHGAGELCDTPEKALETLNHWLENESERLQKVAQLAAKAGRADAAKVIAEHAWQLVS